MLTSRSRRLVPALAAPVLAAVVLAGCASGETATSASRDATGATASAPGPTSTPSATPSTTTEIAVGGGSALPSTWPAELPSYHGGTVLSIVVAEDGAVVNASWSTTQNADLAWQSLEQAFAQAGYTPSAQSGGEGQRIESPELYSDTFTGPTYEANVQVVPGEGNTVFINASRLP